MWNEVEDYVFENRHNFAGISFLAGMGDKDFAQAPMTEVLTEDQIVAKYGKAALFASGLIVDTRKQGFRDLWEATQIAQTPPEYQGKYLTYVLNGLDGSISLLTTTLWGILRKLSIA